MARHVLWSFGVAPQQARLLTSPEEYEYRLPAQRTVFFYHSHFLLTSYSANMVVAFINDFASLPADGSKDHPHVIDVSAYNISIDEHDYQMTYEPKFRLWDAVATLLHIISPDTLRDFLDPGKTEVKLDLVSRGEETCIVIWKKGTEVLVRERSNLTARQRPWLTK